MLAKLKGVRVPLRHIILILLTNFAIFDTDPRINPRYGDRQLMTTLRLAPLGFRPGSLFGLGSRSRHFNCGFLQLRRQPLNKLQGRSIPVPGFIECDPSAYRSEIPVHENVSSIVDEHEFAN